MVHEPEMTPSYGRPLYCPPLPDSTTTSFGPRVVTTPQQQGLYEMEIKKEDSYCLAPQDSYKLAVMW